jgi:hypothetical protein
MEPEGSLPCSQEPTTCPYLEPNESNPHPKPYFPKIFNINMLSVTLIAMNSSQVISHVTM